MRRTLGSPWSWPVRAQLTGIVALVAVLMLGTGGWLAVAARGDAERTANRAASFQADLAASAITEAVTAGTSAMVGLAGQLPLPALLASPSKCTLSFSELGVFARGHIDIVLPDGRVPCSSVQKSGAPAGATQAGADWLGDPSTRRTPRLTGRFTDRLTGKSAVAITAPIAGKNGATDAFAVAVLPLDGLALGLSRTYGGPQHFAFTVRTADGQVLAGPSPADRGSSIVRTAAVPASGWQVAASQPRAKALEPVTNAFTRLAILAIVGLAILLALMFMLNRGIARPLRRLTETAVRASRGGTAEVVSVSGPAEVRLLADEFNTMIEARAGHENQLIQHSLHDPLTGLPNRALALDRIGLALRNAADRGASVDVLSVDLDRFKVVNASLGDAAGDLVLKITADRLAALMTADETLARSGDGFLICRSHNAGISSTILADELVRCIAEPVVIAGTEVALTASVGVAGSIGMTTAEDLVRDADTAMHAAKAAGGARSRHIDAELRDTSSSRLKLESDLRGALQRGELHLEYQPVINLLDNQITGVEALLRWTHPTHGAVPPNVFIPIAENAGLIRPIGQFVLEQACGQAALWNEAGHHLRVSVNMSGLELHAPGFVNQVTDILRRAGIEASQLCLELTETVLMDDAKRGADILHELKELGVDLSIDDFGTGYSSLGYLQRFPVDELKIDRCFVQSLGSNGQDHSLVAAMVAMGHALGLHIVAEGVETPEQQSVLLTLGCRAAQGYLFSRPQPPGRISQLLSSERIKHPRSGAAPGGRSTAL